MVNLYVRFHIAGSEESTEAEVMSPVPLRGSDEITEKS
jgi:hypothetical protein